MVEPSITRLLALLDDHEFRARKSVNFTPSENVLSPLARLPFVLDGYSRYFFDYFRDSFVSGLEIGRAQIEIIEPVLRSMAHAKYVDVRPLSGMSCATIAIGALCSAGGVAVTVPAESGGHTSTDAVAGRFGIRVLPLPMRDVHFVDLDRLEDLLSKVKPNLIYLDQSSLLFPIDPAPIRSLIEIRSPETILHVDSSHTNGLILGGALMNPLDRGAHSFGGSTHKTLPGPHKGFLATNDSGIRDRFSAIAYHFVSHHHLAATVSLGVTLLEMRDCGGEKYAKLVIENAIQFAGRLSARGIPVAGAVNGFTGCHQVWVMAGDGVDVFGVAKRMYRQGILVNLFRELPGLDSPALRLSLAEVTRMGATVRDIDALVEIFSRLLSGSVEDVSDEVASISARLSKPQFCFTSHALTGMGSESSLLPVMDLLASFRGDDS